jgi:aryl carrier-like protein
MTNDSAAPQPTLDQLRESVAALLHTDPSSINDDTDLLLLGLESLSVMKLVNGWRRQGVRVSSRVLVAEPTLRAWQRHLDESRRAAASEEHISPLRPTVAAARDGRSQPPTEPA